MTLLLEYKWAVTRAIDRIGLASYQHIPLSDHVNKLEGLARHLLDEEDTWDQDWVDRYKAAGEEGAGLFFETATLSDILWERFGLLIELFSHHGLFEEEEVPWERYEAFTEIADQGATGATA